MSTNHVSVRLDPETIARVDALAPQLSTQWRPATRSDILRALILMALARHESEEPLVPAPAAGAGAAEAGEEELPEAHLGRRRRKSSPGRR